MRVNIIGWLVLRSLVSKDSLADPIFHESLCLRPPTAGLCPKTLHLDLVIPPWGGFDPGPPSSQFLEYYYYYTLFEKNLYQKSFLRRHGSFEHSCLFALIFQGKVFDIINSFPFKPISFLAISAFLLEKHEFSLLPPNKRVLKEI